MEIFTPFPNMTTKRLTLRQVKIEDENEIFILRSDEEVLKFLDGPKYNTIDEARQFINRINDGITKNESILWAITLKNENKLVGTICLWNIVKEYSIAEIGFELLPNYQGNGIMHEAVAEVIKYGFENMKLRSIEGYTNANNLKSRSLLENNGFIKKVNFSLSDEKISDTIIYTLKNNNIE